MFFDNDLITLALKISDFVVICLITGAQGGRERKGSFSGRFQSLCRKLSNTSIDYESLSRKVKLKKTCDIIILLAPFQFDLCYHILTHTQFSYFSYCFQGSRSAHRR